MNAANSSQDDEISDDDIPDKISGFANTTKFLVMKRANHEVGSRPLLKFLKKS